LTPEVAVRLARDLTEALRNEGDRSVQHIHVIVEQVDADGPWELVLSVVHESV
jgi:hypothetical protein